MALVKTSKIASRKPAVSAERALQPAAPQRAPTARSAAGGKRDKVSERVAAATEQLASGLTQAAAAAEELRRSMEQIAAGADEAAGGAQEQFAAIGSIVENLTTARAQAEASRRRTEAVQGVLAETAVQITTSVRAIERNAQRQASSASTIGELDLRARDIGELTVTVTRISDQTNLLALNAAIEAARAGDHGRGFAVVAEEVRALAETSEKSAGDVQTLAESIQAEVRDIVAAIGTAADTAVAEARSGAAVVAALDALRGDMIKVGSGSEDILNAAMEAERAATEAQRGAEQVASAAEEQSAAAGQAQTAIQQQAQSLDQGQVAAQSLAGLADNLRAGDADEAAAEQISAAAEELSATIQELSSAATEILAAVEQITRGSQQQAAATQETSAALAQIEASADVARTNASDAYDRVQTVEVALKESRTAVGKLVEGVGLAAETTQASLAALVRLEATGRRIEKTVDSIGLVAVQTTMLAVSGSVEAARAGDAGRGFAVVSNDIRTLAREASESIDRAKDTARAILDQIAELRRDLEQIVVTAELEIQNNRGIATTLERLDADVGAMRAANQTILAGAQAIQTATAQTADGARQIAAAAEEASAASRQAATASSEQAKGAEDLAAAIEEIAALADELKQQNG